MNKQKQLTINLTASLVAFAVNIGINFFLTPYIIRTLGVEAYGFVSLGANFINYATLITLALNSMAGRFITIEIHRNNWEAANKYFSSVVIANLGFAGVILVPAAFFILYIDRIINVPSDILTDVRILFAFLFINFLIGIASSCFSVATFATNRLYLQSVRGIESNIIRALLLILLFVFFNPAVSYIGIIAFVVLLYTTFFNIFYTKKFLPEVRISKTFFDFKAVAELISSGIWNSLVQLGNILLQGLNLLIANLLISASAMGMLAVSNTIPTVLASLIGTIAGVFMPDFTILYAKRNVEELVISIKRSMKILGLITNIPIAILVAFGEEFYSLWVPNQDPRALQILSILGVSIFIVSGSINSLYGVFTVTNRIKVNAIILIGTGVLNVLIVLGLLKTTNLGVYAVVGVSTVLGIIRNLAYTAPYGAKYLGLKWNTFFPEIFKSMLGFCVVLSIGAVLNFLFEISSWYTLIAVACITALLGLMVNLLIVLDRSERQDLLGLIKVRGRERA